MSKNIFRGIVVPMLTPFNEDKSLDEKTLSEFTNWLCCKNVDILFPMGGSGEYSYLTTDERKRIIEIIISSSEKRVPVMPGTGGSSLKETISLSVFAQQNGADAVGVVLPNFIDASEESFFNYYKQIDEGLNIPIMVYDPKGSGEYSITPKLMKRMAEELKNVRAIKYRTTNGELMAQMIKEAGNAGEGISILSGVEFVFLSDLAVGVSGLVGGGANIFPELLKKIQEDFKSCNIESARSCFFKSMECNKILEPVEWPLSGKIALSSLGIPFKPVVRHGSGMFDVRDSRRIKEYFKIDFCNEFLSVKN